MDTIDGAIGADIITIAAAGGCGDTDVMDGGADVDVFYSDCRHTFADNDKLKNIETIKTVILEIRKDSFRSAGSADDYGRCSGDKIIGGEGDIIGYAAGVDIITIAVAGKGDTDVMDGGADADVLQLSAGKHTFADNGC